MMKLTPEIAIVLAQSRAEGDALYLPMVQLERRAHVALYRLLETLGAKWNKKRECHVFPPDVSPKELVESARQFDFDAT